MRLFKGKIPPDQFEGIQWSNWGALTAFPSVLTTLPRPHIKQQVCSQARPALCNQKEQPSIKEIQQGGLIKTLSVSWKQTDM